MASSYRSKYQKKSPFLQVVSASFLLVMVVIMFYFANYLIHERQSMLVSASAGQANIFFEPSTITIPPDGLVNLWITADKQLGFVSAQMSFDRTKLKLAQEIVLDQPALKQVIVKSTMAEANTTGKINLTIAVDPDTVSQAPTGSFKLASLKFSLVTTLADQTANLELVSSSLQLVDLGAIPFIVTSSNSVFSLNPQVASTPTPTPNSATGDLVGPILSLTSGTSRGKLWIKASASDSSGVGLISMSKDGSVLKTCSRKNSCTYYPGDLSLPYDVVVVATDKSSTKNQTTGTITIK